MGLLKLAITKSFSHCLQGNQGSQTFRVSLPAVHSIAPNTYGIRKEFKRYNPDPRCEFRLGNTHNLLADRERRAHLPRKCAGCAGGAREVASGSPRSVTKGTVAPTTH